MPEIPLWLWLQSLIQGITEFLPISSTGHLGLGWAVFSGAGLDVPSAADQQLIDIALHVGTLFAVIVYFYRDIAGVLAGGMALVIVRDQDRAHPNTKLFIMLLVACVPLLLMGMLIAEAREVYKNRLDLIALTTIIFGGLLWVADRFYWSTRTLKHLGYGGAVFIGLMQCLALIPGVSRSGIVMTAGRFLGLDRVEATRFSMLLAIPAIGGAGAFGLLKLVAAGTSIITGLVLWAAFLSFFAALAAIHVLMVLSRRATYLPFVLYRLALGLVIYLCLIFDWIPVTVG